MTYHFANIISWEYYLIKPSLKRKVFVDGFLLQVVILIVTGRWIPKKSGLNFYSKHDFSKALHLSAKVVPGFDNIQLPFWSCLDEIEVDDLLMCHIERYTEIVIGISSPKQERLSELISAKNLDCDIYCLGAAVYSKLIIQSEFVFVTWLTMFFNAPFRTLKKLLESIYQVAVTLLTKRDELKEFVKILDNDRS